MALQGVINALRAIVRGPVTRFWHPAKRKVSENEHWFVACLQR